MYYSMNYNILFFNCIYNRIPGSEESLSIPFCKISDFLFIKQQRYRKRLRFAKLQEISYFCIIIHKIDDTKISFCLIGKCCQ